MTSTDREFRRAAEIIRQSDALIVAAGAGIGVDSGLPDFRGKEGFWKAYPALAKAKLDFTEIANPKAFRMDSQLAWGFYGHRLALYRNTPPHEGFSILKSWMDAMPYGGRVFTSNVDGQFQKAGFSEAQIHECHGSIHYLQCLVKCTNDIWPAEEFIPEADEKTSKLMNNPPACPHCGGMARPNIRMFDDGSWSSHRSDKQEKTQCDWLKYLSGSGAKLAVIEIGAGIAIPSVRLFAQAVSKTNSGQLIRINLRESSVSRVMDIAIGHGALYSLTSLKAMLS